MESGSQVGKSGAISTWEGSMMSCPRERALKEYQQALDTNDNTQSAQETAQKYIQEPYKPDNSRTVVQ